MTDTPPSPGKVSIFTSNAWRGEIQEFQGILHVSLSLSQHGVFSAWAYERSVATLLDGTAMGVLGGGLRSFWLLHLGSSLLAPGFTARERDCVFGILGCMLDRIACCV